MIFKSGQNPIKSDVSKSQLVQATFDGLGIFLYKKTYIDLNPLSNLTTLCLFFYQQYHATEREQVQ